MVVGVISAGQPRLCKRTAEERTRVPEHVTRGGVSGPAESR